MYVRAGEISKASERRTGVGRGVEVGTGEWECWYASKSGSSWRRTRGAAMWSGALGWKCVGAGSRVPGTMSEAPRSMAEPSGGKSGGKVGRDGYVASAYGWSWMSAESESGEVEADAREGTSSGSKIESSSVVEGW